jgi:hypothetical protein
MAVYVVTWNLNKERSNYDQARRAFIAHLERYDNCAEPGLESVRWIHSAGSAAQISEDLRTKLDDNDRLFVSRLRSSEYAGWLNKATWEWIKPRV